MYVQSVVSVDWCCQVQPSGLTTTPCVRPASVSAALHVAFAARLPTHLPLCSAAVSATGLLIHRHNSVIGDTDCVACF